MNMISTNINSRRDALDMLRAEFGSILAERIFEAEAVDFLWESRLRERYLGQQIAAPGGDEEPSRELSRIAVLSCLGAWWHVGICLVDGEGSAIDLLWKRQFESRDDAEFAFLRAR